MKPYLHNLTALRGIAAILVAILHFHFFVGPIVPYEIHSIIDKFYLMVDLFFILSGFIMCYTYSDKLDISFSKLVYKNFLIARLARIYPLHVLTLLTELLIFAIIFLVGKFSILPNWHQHLYRLDAIPIQLLFLENLGIFDFATWNMNAWSLSAEWWAYILFPFLFLIFKKIGYKNWIFGFLTIIACWLCIEFLLAPQQPFLNNPGNANNITLDVTWHYGTFRGIVGFTGGMIIWQLFKNLKFKKILGNSWALVFITVLCICSMQFKWLDTITAILIALILLSSAYGSKTMDSFYSLKPFQKLGDWSFSIYMWHMVLINIFIMYFVLNRDQPINGILRPLNGTTFEMILYLTIFLIITSFIGFLSFTYIENPTRKWIKRKYKY